MRKDYFSEILKIHTDSRTEDGSSFCELHGLTSDEDNHNSIFCNLADWDDSFTSLLEILADKEASLTTGDQDAVYLKFLKVAIPSYLFWMNVLRENLKTLNKLAHENEELGIKIDAWKDLMPTIQSVGEWTNFHKHPGHVLKVHHPRIVIGGKDVGNNSNEYVFDCIAAKEYFDGNKKEQRIKKLQLDDLTATYTHWAIKYPDLIELHTCVMNELGTYLSSIKHKISQDQAYKKWIENLYNKPLCEIQD